jgi:hypothetical protein
VIANTLPPPHHIEAANSEARSATAILRWAIRNERKELELIQTQMTQKPMLRNERKETIAIKTRTIIDAVHGFYSRNIIRPISYQIYEEEPIRAQPSTTL